jgi:hypothetical protein
MARVCLLLALSLACAALLALGWVQPERLPPALQPARLTFAQVYAEWDALLKAKRPDAALELVDELTLIYGAGADAESARGMRLLAIRRGAKEQPRDPRWRAERFLARRTPVEWGLAAGSLVGLLLSFVAFVRRPRPPPPPPPLPPGQVSTAFPPARPELQPPDPPRERPPYVPPPPLE